ncbi:hypothetical protein [Azospirillum rugosum]|uniref:Uncharacterized protein n=1 Tax=Azospirillum rugosum TaxID=416170 RepID=A0ABS4SSF0_9PROT|nr:hypothetical protein [Azospirillum rugosum]MBP2295159.1 hypothetical protein [Azospirillum rugosum]MDQ0528533.1 hypothetical protein [Azospirillum rugosum]
MADCYGNILIPPFDCNDRNGFEAFLKNSNIARSGLFSEGWKVYDQGGLTGAYNFDCQYPTVLEDEWVFVSKEAERFYHNLSEIHKDGFHNEGGYIDFKGEPFVESLFMENRRKTPKQMARTLHPFIRSGALTIQVHGNEKARYFVAEELIVHEDGRWFYWDMQSHTDDEKLNGKWRPKSGRI